MEKIQMDTSAVAKVFICSTYGVSSAGFRHQSAYYLRGTAHVKDQFPIECLVRAWTVAVPLISLVAATQPDLRKSLKGAAVLVFSTVLLDLPDFLCRPLDAHSHYSSPDFLLVGSLLPGSARSKTPSVFDAGVSVWDCRDKGNGKQKNLEIMKSHLSVICICWERHTANWWGSFQLYLKGWRHTHKNH